MQLLPGSSSLFGHGRSSKSVDWADSPNNQKLDSSHEAAKPFMETPAAAPSQPAGGTQSDITSQSSAAVTWITFGGSPGESSGDFIQAIQRVAFQQGHARDDHWIADYISTCFNGNALQWYSDLDDETQDSWRKLRTALLKRFPITSPSPASITSTISASRDSRSPSARNTGVKSGCIEVVGNKTTTLGFLCLDSAACVRITTTKANALVVNVPAQPSSEPVQVSTSNPLTTDFPNLGLALLKNFNFDPDQIPEEVKMAVQPSKYGGGDYLAGIPGMSSVCNGPAIERDGPVIATWTLSLCGDSKTADIYRRRAATKVPLQRAAAAVWKYETSTNELRIIWLMDDDTECELGAYSQRYSMLSPHAHRIKDMEEAGSVFEEGRVRFVLHPNE